MSYVPLHLHSDYSLLDGLAKVKDIAKKCKELGLPACSLTDHGTLGGSIAFYKACKAEGVKPIIGCEVYICNDRFDKTTKEQHHLILLAKDTEGYQNLVKLCSAGHLEGFYHKPRIDYTLLRECSKGLIALSSCLGGHIPRLIMQDKYDEAESLALWHKEVFGDDFYLEIQNHGIEKEREVAEIMKFMSAETGIKLVATGDSHYVNKEDSDAHELLLAMQTKTIKGSENAYKFSGEGYHIQSYEEMARRFDPLHLETTLEIANKCNLELDMETNHYPVFPHDGNNKDLLMKDILIGAKELYGNKDKRFKQMAWDRIRFELDIIERMGFIDYFLVVADFIRFARGVGIPVGAGRGSGAGSVVAYLTRITDVCPLEHALLFERFLNPDRVSPPDFDIDFCKDRRGEVIDYVRKKYTGVSQIGTYGTIKIKSAIKDISRTLGYDVPFSNGLCKLVSDDDNTFGEELDGNDEFRDQYDKCSKTREVVKYGKKLFGIKKNVGKHACGVIIADYDISTVVPTMLALDSDTGEKHECTQLDAPECESLGLLKMDFLGLKTLTVCSDAINNINNNGNDCPMFDNVPLEDELAYELIRQGDTENVFQIESAGMRDTCRSVKPFKLSHLSDILALYRPGPMEYIPTYVARKDGDEEMEFAHPAMEEITGDTYGIMVYQEQIMQVVQRIAGLSLAQSDILRRAIGKKKAELLAQQKEVFIKGALENNVEGKTANGIWDDILKFADYGFNKSHSIAYAVLTARTAYLKAHYTAEYLSACMSNEKDMDKIKPILAECKRKGIKVVPPCINKGGIKFNAHKGIIYYGIKAVNGIGVSILEPIISEREANGEFDSFFDFWTRCRPNKKAIISLAKAGALDSFVNRSSLLENIEDVMKQTAHFKKVIQRLAKRGEECKIDYTEKRNIRNLSLLEGAQNDFENMSFDLPYAPPMEMKDVLNNEMESIGCYLSGHPLSEYEGVYDTDVIADMEDGDNVQLLCNITKAEVKTSAKGNKFAIVSLMSLEEEFESLMFSKQLAKYEEKLIVGSNVIVMGVVRRDNGSLESKVIINKIGGC